MLDSCREKIIRTACLSQQLWAQLKTFRQALNAAPRKGYKLAQDIYSSD